MILRIILSKPKLIFGAVRLGAGQSTYWIFGYYIPLISLRRDNWLRHFYKREDIVECSVKIKFTTTTGQILYNYAEWWNNPITDPSKTLHADSIPCEFPLIYRSQRREISLAGTPMETNAPLPPYRISNDEDIVAHVKVFSRNNRIARSRWLIHQKPDLEVRRLEANEL